jgi:quercetin dioxygenase-like cupin family protein
MNAISPKVLGPGEGEQYWVVGDHITIKVGPEQTNGIFTLIETIVAPGGGPPTHLHRNEDEIFYVVDGDFAFISNKQILRGLAGFAAYLPKGIPHTFKNVGDRSGKLVVAAVPSGFERFVRQVGEVARDSINIPPVTPEAISRLMAGCAQYGVEMLPEWQTTGQAAAQPECEKLWVIGEKVVIRLTSAETAGGFSMAEITSRPGGGVPPHLHKREDEMFYILDGTYEFVIDGKSHTLTSGAFAFVPRGTFHSFRNIGTTQARMLDYHTPGGFEKFFYAAGTPCTDDIAPTDPIDMSRMMKIFMDHGMELPALR